MKNSYLLDKRKEGNKSISTTTDERLEILRDSGGSFRSDSGNYVTERLKHSGRNWIGCLLSSKD